MYEIKTENLRLTDSQTVYTVTVKLDDVDKRREICECINLIMSGQLRKNIEKNDDEVRGLKQTIDRLNADNEKLKKACRTNSEMCINLMRLTNLNPELIKKNEELEKKNAELEAKHWDECRQIAQYDDNLKRLFNEMLDCLNGMSESANRFSRILRANADPYKQPDKSPAPKVEHINCKCDANTIDIGNALENSLKKMVDKATKKATMNTGDYFNREGLLVCGKCRKPKECEIEMFGNPPHIVPCLCGCVETTVKTREVSE